MIPYNIRLYIQYMLIKVNPFGKHKPTQNSCLKTSTDQTNTTKGPPLMPSVSI